MISYARISKIGQLADLFIFIFPFITTIPILIQINESITNTQK
jgi:hypothetical protein